MQKNIIFSSTRQFNIGDEFVLLGILRLFRKLNLKFNPILYNRSPEVRQTFTFINPLRKHVDKTNKNIFLTLVSSFLRIGFEDNSWRNAKDGDTIDAVVFGGTPEWGGGKMIPLYEVTNNFNVPTYYIGIGIGSSEVIAKRGKIMQPYMERTWNKAKLITTRDKTTYDFFNKIRPGFTYQLPCPALFVANKEKRVTKLNKIGIVFSTYKASYGNNITKDTYDKLIPIYKNLLSKYNCSIICHHIEEVIEARRVFPGKEILYSYAAEDYIKIYEQFDLIIGTRVHGSGIASSLGIPSILFAHDYRADTAIGFKAEILQIKDITKDLINGEIEWIKNNIQSISKSLIKHKKESEKEYLSILKVHTRDLQ